MPPTEGRLRVLERTFRRLGADTNVSARGRQMSLLARNGRPRKVGMMNSELRLAEAEHAAGLRQKGENEDE